MNRFSEFHWNPIRGRSDCYSYSGSLARAIKDRGLVYFEVKQVEKFTFQGVPFPIHYQPILIPKPQSRFGRVLVDAYLWPAMNELDPDDSVLINDEF